MSYIGQPLNAGNLAVQTGTGDGADTTPIATLDYSVGSSESLAIYLDGVKQAVSTYTASGTTLTFTTAPPNLVGIEVVFLALPISLPTPGDNTVTSAKIVDGAIVNADINASAAIAYSKLNLATSLVDADINASAGIAYTKMLRTDVPAFRAVVSGTQSNVSGDSTVYEATGAIWNETYDIGSNFSNGVFTAPVAGWYLFYAHWVLSGVLAGHTNWNFLLTATGGNMAGHNINYIPIYLGGYVIHDASWLHYMSASDTCNLRLEVQNSTLVVDVLNQTTFNGVLIA